MYIEGNKHRDCPIIDTCNIGTCPVSCITRNELLYKRSKVKVMIVGGGFEPAKESSIIKIMAQGFVGSDGAAFNVEALEVINGGELKDLPVRLMDDLIIWMPNISNETEKQYPKKKQGSVLICSKVMREDYTTIDAISRIFKMGGNAVIAIYQDTSSIIRRFKLIDALGNIWYDGYSLADLVNAIKAIYTFTKRSVRVNVHKSPIESIELQDRKDVSNVMELININRDLASKIQASCGSRFFGNTSTRCQQLFPTARSYELILFSPRNSDKSQLEINDLVPCYEYQDQILFIGNKKPSVDTPIQMKIYKECDHVKYMIHGHAKIVGANETSQYYLCGDVREADEVIEMIHRRYKEHDLTSGAINLKNHGFLMWSNSISELAFLARTLAFEYGIGNKIKPSVLLSETSEMSKIYQEKEVKLRGDRMLFRKKYLKDGMIVETRNGNLYLVLNGLLMKSDGREFLDIEHYYDDLTRETPAYDIVKLYESKCKVLDDLFNKERLIALLVRDKIE